MMNTQPIRMPKNRLVAVASPPVIGLKKPAKFRPIWSPMISPANSTAVKTIRTAKPSDTPITSCWITASRAAPELSGITGMAGKLAWAQNAIRNASATRTRAGTLRWPITGNEPKSASTRKKGHRIGVIHSSTWVSVKVSMAMGRSALFGVVHRRRPPARTGVSPPPTGSTARCVANIRPGWSASTARQLPARRRRQ